MNQGFLYQNFPHFLWRNLPALAPRSGERKRIWNGEKFPVSKTILTPPFRVPFTPIFATSVTPISDTRLTSVLDTLSTPISNTLSPPFPTHLLHVFQISFLTWFVPLPMFPPCTGVQVCHNDLFPPLKGYRKGIWIVMYLSFQVLGLQSSPSGAQLLANSILVIRANKGADANKGAERQGQYIILNWVNHFLLLSLAKGQFYAELVGLLFHSPSETSNVHGGGSCSQPITGTYARGHRTIALETHFNGKGGLPPWIWTHQETELLVLQPMHNDLL